MQTIFYIIEIFLSVIGIGLILMQQHSEEGSSFFASSTETFKLRDTKEKVLFFLTVAVIILFLVVLVLHKRLV